MSCYVDLPCLSLTLMWKIHFVIQLHSVFLHARKIRRMAGVRDSRSKIVKIEWVLNLVTFIAARFVSHVLITVKLIRDASKFGKGVELPLALFGMAGMNLLNAFLGIDLLKAYRRERKTHNSITKSSWITDLKAWICFFRNRTCRLFHSFLFLQKKGVGFCNLL